MENKFLGGKKTMPNTCPQNVYRIYTQLSGQYNLNNKLYCFNHTPKPSRDADNANSSSLPNLMFYSFCERRNILRKLMLLQNT